MPLQIPWLTESKADKALLDQSSDHPPSTPGRVRFVPIRDKRSPLSHCSIVSSLFLLRLPLSPVVSGPNPQILLLFSHLYFFESLGVCFERRFYLRNLSSVSLSLSFFVSIFRESPPLFHSFLLTLSRLMHPYRKLQVKTFR